MLPDEKTHYSQRGQCFLTKKCTIPSGDSASWQKNALSPSFHTPLKLILSKRISYIYREKIFYSL